MTPMTWPHFTEAAELTGPAVDCSSLQTRLHGIDRLHRSVGGSSDDQSLGHR
jgi:hypothetical protein